MNSLRKVPTDSFLPLIVAILVILIIMLSVGLCYSIFLRNQEKQEQSRIYKEILVSDTIQSQNGQIMILQYKEFKEDK